MEVEVVVLFIHLMLQLLLMQILKKISSHFRFKIASAKCVLSELFVTVMLCQFLLLTSSSPNKFQQN